MENKNFAAYPYDTKSFSQIVDLWSEQYVRHEIDNRRVLFQWISTGNPFLEEDPPYLLLWDGARVIGMHGRMPLWFSVYGRKQRGYFAHDVLLSKDYRGKGLGKIILNETFKDPDIFAGALWFNEPNYRLYRKCDWLDIPNLHSFVRIYNPGVFLKEAVKNQVIRRILSSVLSKLIQLKNLYRGSHSYDDVKIEEIDVFDDSFDEFFARIAPRYGIMVARNSRYLNWKFVQKPFNNYKRYAAFDRSGELSGYMVTKSECYETLNRGRIIDFLVDPDKLRIFEALVNFCCKDFRKTKVDYVQLISSVPIIIGLVKKNGFMQARKPVRFMVKNWEQYFEESSVGNIDNWYVTESDGDGDAWVADSVERPKTSASDVTLKTTVHPSKAKREGEKIRIAFVVWTLEGMGGSEHVVFDIARKLDRNMFEVVIVGFKDGPVRNRYEHLGIKVTVVEKQKKYDLQFIRSLRNIFKQNGVQLVNAHHFSPFLYTCLATIMTGIKIIYTEHSVWQYRQMSGIKKQLCNLLLWKATAVVAISKQLFKYYVNNPFISRKKIHLIVNGVDLSRFRKYTAPSIKKELGFKQDDVVVGMIANLRPEKNHKVLISAFSRLADDLIHSHLVLVGLDCMNGEIQKLAAGTGCKERIHFLGNRENVEDLLNAFDVFCLPSIYEGLPLTILEAMACEVAVVGADSMGINEIISHNQNGLLFETGNDKMLAETLKLVLQDEGLRNRLQQAGLSYVKVNYCLDTKIREYQKLFASLSNKTYDFSSVSEGYAGNELSK